MKKLKRILKTALGIFVFFFAGASKLYAINSNARILLSGMIAEETQMQGADPKIDFLKLGNATQKDSDGIVFDVAGENFGGSVGLWYTVNKNITTDTGSAISFRRTNIWFVPVDNLKVSVGYVGNDQLYKERIDGWKVGNPFAISARDWSKHPGYINCSDVDDMGFGIEVKPMDGLVLTGGVARRAGTPGKFGHGFFTSEDGENVFDAWGLTARYYFSDFCFQVAYRDNGSKQWKVARAAVGYEANGFYGFVQPCFGIDYNSEKDSYELSGICLDLYGEYKIGSWGFLFHVPVTFRLTEKEKDPSYFEYSILARCNIGSIGNMADITPSLRFGSKVQDGDNEYAPIRFGKDFADSMNFCIAPGIGFNVGPANFSVGFNLMINSKLYMQAEKHEKIEWNIPFSTVLKF